MAFLPPVVVSIVFGLLFALETSGKSNELDNNELTTQFRSIDPGMNLESNEIQNQAILLNETQNHIGKFLPKTTFGNYDFLVTKRISIIYYVQHKNEIFKFYCFLYF